MDTPVVILFLHGWTSVPGGVKPSYLQQHGCEVLNPKLPDEDFPASLRIANELFAEHQPAVVVGSSRGGAVALNMNSGDAPLVLLCPAWRRWGDASKTKKNTLILHSRADDVIPFDESEQLLANSGLDSSVLIETGGDHRLADEQSLQAMLRACRTLTNRRHT